MANTFTITPLATPSGPVFPLFSNVRPTSPAIVSFAQMQSQLRITATDEEQYIMDLVDAATEYAETALSASLLQRTITTVVGSDFHLPAYGIFYDHHHNRMTLPRGPVSAVNSIVDVNGTAITNFALTRHGNSDGLVIRQSPGFGYSFPVTITYTAGYGPNVTDVPADIRMGIRTHVASLWRVRTSIEEGALMPVPHSLEAFYRAKARSVCVA